MRLTMRRHAAIFLAVLAAGCATHPYVPPDHSESVAQATERRAQAPRPAYNLAGYPPAVRDGYIDGCESARQSEFARRDTRRMDADPQYSMGWNDGYSICGRK
jgi:hypothetical protein